MYFISYFKLSKQKKNNNNNTKVYKITTKNSDRYIPTRYILCEFIRIVVNLLGSN